jgi:hypothetical protein
MKSKWFIMTACAISVLVFLFSFNGDLRAQCTLDAECDDGLFCTGTETCLNGSCVAVSACPPSIVGCVTRGYSCDEDNDLCVDFADNSLCDDGVFCNGTETCDLATGDCVAVSACPPAIDGCVTRGYACDEVNDLCVDFADDSQCDAGQFCDMTTGDCMQITCGMVQLITQEAVTSNGPYKNHGQMVKTAAHAANPYLYEGIISQECHSCIVSQFAKRIPVEEQQVCE